MFAGFRVTGLLLGLIGCVIGGTLGYLGFGWVLGQGFYAMVLPGAAVGFGCGALTRGRCVIYGIVSAVIGLGLSLYTEWHFFPFKADPGFGYFLAHLHQLKPIALLMIAVGTASAYWMGVGRDSFPRSRADAVGENNSSA